MVGAARRTTLRDSCSKILEFPVSSLDTQEPGRYLVPMVQPYRVFVVVDREFGQRLTKLAEMGPVWVADTPVNRSVAREIWAAHPNRSHLEGVTAFKVTEGTSCEDMLLNEMDTIEIHRDLFGESTVHGTGRRWHCDNRKIKG